MLTSGRKKSVQDAPTANDHDCTDAKPYKHTQTIALRKNYVIADIYGLCEWYKGRNDFKGGLEYDAGNL